MGRTARKKRAEWMVLLILFCAGFLWDAILSLDVIVTAEREYVTAAITTFIITVLAFTVYDAIIDRDGVKKWRMLALASGSAVGAGVMTYILS